MRTCDVEFELFLPAAVFNYVLSVITYLNARILENKMGSCREYILKNFRFPAVSIIAPFQITLKYYYIPVCELL